MHKTTRKYIALLLCLAVLGSLFAGTATAAVEMPAGLTESQMEAAIPKAESLVGAVLKMNEETADLSGMVYGRLFADDTLNKIFSSVYSSLADQASTFSTLGIDLTPTGVSPYLANYPDVQAALAGKTDWNEVFGADFAPKWNVSTKDGFGYALAAMFAPMEGLLHSLLCGSTYRVNALVSITGAEGYNSAIVPIFEALKTPQIFTQEEFSADAKNDRSTMMRNIAIMLFSAIDAILASPVDSLCSVLPSAANYLVSGSLGDALTTLLEPMRVRVGVISLSGMDSLIEKMGGFSSDDLTKMIENADTSALFGSDVNLTLPKIDLEALAGCGSVSGGTYTANKAQSFTLILRWGIEAVKLNAASLPAMLGQDLSGAQSFLDKLLAKDTDAILKMLLDLMNLSASDTVLNYQWTYPEYTPGSVEYTPNLTRENYEKVLLGIDDTLNEFLQEFTDSGTLSGVLAARIYSNSLVSQLVTGVYGALYTEQTGPMLEMLGVDASPAGVADSIASAYPSAAQTLRAYESWDKISASSLSWGFTNGSKEGFQNAVTAVLAPFRPFLTLLLAEGSVQLLDTITVSGSNGYNNAVIPLLEALGCSADSIKDYNTYKSTANTNAVITDILTPVTGLLDSLIAAPVATICRILPNIVYFINAGGLKQCIENLLYPVRVLLRAIDAEDLLSAELTQMADIDLSATMDQMISESGLNIKLPAPDLTKLASLGQAQQLTSKRTYNGIATSYTYIEADQPAVLITVLRYVVGALGSEENSAAFSNMLAQDQTQEGDMMAMYTQKVAEQLKTMSTDETIEWLFNLLFAETPHRDKSALDDGEIPHVIYHETEKHTTRNVGVIVAVAVVLLIAGALIFSRVDLSARRELKRRKKLQKKQETEQRKTLARQQAAVRQTAAQPYPAAAPANMAQQTPGRPMQPQAARQPVRLEQRPGVMLPVRPAAVPPVSQQRTAQPVAQQQSVAQPAQTQQQRIAQPSGNTAAPAQSGAPAAMTPQQRKRHEKELQKMQMREEKHRVKAARKNRKASRYYQQAVREQQKKSQ